MRQDHQQETHDKGLQSPSAKVAITSLDKVIGELDCALNQGAWLAGKTFSLADATAAPYIVRARGLNLSGLWENRANIAPWLARAVDKVNAYTVENRWGSSAFRELVKKHADAAQPEIEELTAEFSRADGKQENPCASST